MRELNNMQLTSSGELRMPFGVKSTNGAFQLRKGVIAKNLIDVLLDI